MGVVTKRFAEAYNRVDIAAAVEFYTDDTDLDIQLKESYKEADWDWDTGKPSVNKLKELGLDFCVKDIWGKSSWVYHGI